MFKKLGKKFLIAVISSELYRSFEAYCKKNEEKWQVERLAKLKKHAGKKRSYLHKLKRRLFAYIVCVLKGDKKEHDRKMKLKMEQVIKSLKEKEGAAEFRRKVKRMLKE